MFSSNSGESNGVNNQMVPQNANWNQNPTMSQNANWNQNPTMSQNATWNQNPTMSQNANWNQNPTMSQNVNWNQNPNMNQNPNVKGKSGKNKVIICGILTALITALVVSLVFVALIMPNTGTNSVLGGADKYEGKGYKTAGAAVEAYVDAYNEQDYSNMLSTFAVESYVENYSLAAYINRLGCYNPTFNMRYTNENDFTNEMLIHSRIMEIQKSLNYQYYELAGINEKMEQRGENQFETAIVTDGEEYCEELFSDLNNIPTITVKGEVDFEDLFPEKKEGIREQIETYNDEYNKYLCAEDIEPVILELSTNDKSYYLFAECAKYNGAWYIVHFDSVEGSIVGLDVSKAGLWPIEQ